MFTTHRDEVHGPVDAICMNNTYLLLTVTKKTISITKQELRTYLTNFQSHLNHLMQPRTLRVNLQVSSSRGGAKQT